MQTQHTDQFIPRGNDHTLAANGRSLTPGLNMEFEIRQPLPNPTPEGEAAREKRSQDEFKNAQLTAANQRAQIAQDTANALEAQNLAQQTEMQILLQRLAVAEEDARVAKLNAISATNAAAEVALANGTATAAPAPEKAKGK